MIVTITLIVFLVWLVILTRIVTKSNKESLYILASIVEIAKTAANTPEELFKLRNLSRNIKKQLE